MQYLDDDSEQNTILRIICLHTTSAIATAAATLGISFGIVCSAFYIPSPANNINGCGIALSSCKTCTFIAARKSLMNFYNSKFKS